MIFYLFAKHFKWYLSGAIIFFYVTASFAQGFIIAKNKTRRVDVELLKYETKIEVDNNIAQIEVKQEFFNPTSKAVQANYYFVFPKKSQVNGCTLELEGTVFSGELMPESRSAQLCFEFIKDGLSPSFFNLTERQWFQGNAYQIPAKGKRFITFKYSQILKEDGGLTRLDFPRYPVALRKSADNTILGNWSQSYTMLASTAVSFEGLDTLTRGVGLFDKSLKVSLRSDALIKNLYSPNCTLNISRKNRNKVDLTVKDEDLFVNDFVLYYAQNDNDIGCNVISYRPDKSEDGYFMLLASTVNPVASSNILPRDVVFVLDVSGSMKGEKLRLAKDGLKRCISSLKDSDYFNIITYSSQVKIYQKNLVKASQFSANAYEYVEALGSGGGTNMNEALLTALSIKPKYNNIKQIIFITDGEPTVGVTDIFTIQENVRRLNMYNYQIHSFAIKSDVNAKLLQGLTSLTHGHSDYVERLPELSDRLVDFFESVKSPVLGSIKFSVPDGNLYDVFGNNYLNIYQDGLIVIVGRYREPGKFDLILSGKGINGEKKLNFDINFESVASENAFIKYIWQKRKLGFTLEYDEFFDDSDYENIKRMSLFLESFELNDSKNMKPVGAKAIEKARTLKSLKEAVSLNEALTAKTKIVNEKVFKLSDDGYWEDVLNLPGSEDEKNTIHIKYGSDAYFKLAGNIPSLQPFLAISDRLKFGYADYLIKIDKSGLEKVNNFPF